MILPSFTSKEIYDHVVRDQEKVNIRKEYLRSKAIKEFKKEKHFPAWRWYEYTVPTSNNKYIIFFYVESKIVIQKPFVDDFLVIFEESKKFIKCGVGMYKHTENNPFIAIRQVHVYTSHFLMRYGERYLNDNSLNFNDIACLYFSRNRKCMPIKMNEEINKRLEQYGETAKYGYVIRDGFCFTRMRLEGLMSEDGNRDKDKIDASLTIYTTFMPNDGLKNSQLTAIYKEYDEKSMQCLLEFEKEAKNGVITLCLEP